MSDDVEQLFPLVSKLAVITVKQQKHNNAAIQIPIEI